jgi:hypothetical protein
MALTGLGTGSVALFRISHGLTALAQEATPTSTVPRQSHPFLGAWHWVSRESGGQQNRIGVFSVDGTYLEYFPDLGIGIGGWRPTGARTGELFLLYQTVPEPVGRDEIFSPYYVPTGHAFRPGVFIQRYTSVAVDETENTMTASGTSEAYDPEGNLGFGPFPSEPETANRMVDVA